VAQIVRKADIEAAACHHQKGENDDETHDKAVELQEETGYYSDDLELLLSIYTTVAFCNEKIDIYLAKNLKPGRQHLDEDEYVQYEAYPVEELMNKIFRCEIQDSKTVAAILAYNEYRRKQEHN